MGIFSFLLSPKKHNASLVSLKKSKLIGSKKGGYLSHFNLWSFWSSLTISSRNKILTYYEETPLMFDPKSIFRGNFNYPENFKNQTPISILNMLLVIDDVELLDDCFNKFEEYSNEKYGFSYWIDSHFFMSNISKRAYRMFINNHCDDERFINCFNFEYYNQKDIIKSLKKDDLFPVSNPIFEQYLIYLEKKKKFADVIKLANEFKGFGWKNKFDKRIDRCKLKMKRNEK